MKFSNFFRPTLALVVILTIISSQSEAKKIKLKDLKKLKKYAYLLAFQGKRFYPIPFPLPLPVFVKRQQIYTQVPIVPRYVQQAPSQQYHASGYHQDSTYSAMSGNSPMPSYYSPPVSYHQDYEASASHDSGQPEEQAQRNKDHNHIGSVRDPTSRAASGLNPSRYLAQVGMAISKAYPGLISDSQRELIGKLLSGEAKIATPSQIRIGSLRYNLRQNKQVSPEQAERDHQAAMDASMDSQTNSTRGEHYDGGNEIKASASHQQARTLRHPVPRMRPHQVKVRQYMRSPAHEGHRHVGLSSLPYPRFEEPSFLANPLLAATLLEKARDLQEAASLDDATNADPADELAQLEDKVRQEQANLLALEALRHREALNQHQHQQQIRQEQEEDKLQQEQNIQMKKREEEMKMVLEKEQERRIAESNSMALMSRQLGLPLLPGHLRLLNI